MKVFKFFSPKIREICHYHRLIKCLKPLLAHKNVLPVHLNKEFPERIGIISFSLLTLISYLTNYTNNKTGVKK